MPKSERAGASGARFRSSANLTVICFYSKWNRTTSMAVRACESKECLATGFKRQVWKLASTLLESPCDVCHSTAKKLAK